MRILLEKSERESFKNFLGEYALSCTDAMEKASEYVKDEDLLNQTSGKNKNDLINEILDGTCKLEPLVIVYGEDEEGRLSVEIDSEIVSAYSNYVATSMKVLRPYTSELTTIAAKHKDTINSLLRSANKLTKSKIMPLVRGVANLVGASELLADIESLVDRFVEEESGINTMMKLNKGFEQEVMNRVQDRREYMDYFNGFHE